MVSFLDFPFLSVCPFEPKVLLSFSCFDFSKSCVNGWVRGWVKIGSRWVSSCESEGSSSTFENLISSSLVPSVIIIAVRILFNRRLHFFVGIFLMPQITNSCRLHMIWMWIGHRLQMYMDWMWAVCSLPYSTILPSTLMVDVQNCRIFHHTPDRCVSLISRGFDKFPSENVYEMCKVTGVHGH